MPRFVVLTHNHPALHWDFMLEEGKHLRTWRLARLPDSGGEIDAEAVPDHRLAYLDYEGPVSRGRGEVIRWDRGEYETVEATGECLVLRVKGERLGGMISLERSSDSSLWTFRRR